VRRGKFLEQRGEIGFHGQFLDGLADFDAELEPAFPGLATSSRSASRERS
jgi:hypothetical protein